MVRVVVAAFAVLLTLSGCTTALVPTPSPTTTENTPDGAPGCAPASPISLGLPEVRGTSTRGDTSLFGWIMADQSGIHTGSDIKIVWRMVGDGDLRVQLLAPDGTDHPLSWGPEEHGGSNYDRPGREWGTGIVLDSPGCWQLNFTTDTTAASVWFEATS